MVCVLSQFLNRGFPEEKNTPFRNLRLGLKIQGVLCITWEKEMDELKKCVQAYEELINKNYILTLENDIKIEIPFKAHHFYHLIGLQYLTDDIVQVRKTPTQTATSIYRSIKKEHITYDDISKSKYIGKIQDRILNFPNIKDVLSHKIIIDFDPTKVERTSVKAKYILYKPYERTYLHLFLAADDNIFYPESFIYEPSNYYISGQNLLDIKDVEILTSENNTKKKIYI